MTEQHAQLHRFHTGNAVGERGTRLAVYLTAVMMVVEIVAGYWSKSMALLADGWHMSSHALALGLSVVAYILARKYASDPRFSMGTWKIEILAAFASAIFLLGIAAMMIVQSIERLIAPTAIHYQQAIGVAVLGLIVNLVCAKLLMGHHDEGHSHDHHHAHHDHSHSHGQDLNLRAAYIHVLTDAATSVLAIIALIGGLFLGAAWLDPVMGIVGAVLVGSWALGLLRDTSKILVDAEMDAPVATEIREAIVGVDPEAITEDLHVWRVAKDKYACMMTVKVKNYQSPDRFRQAIQIHEELVHITIEVLLVPPSSN